jgi:hypothetical protein
MIEYLLQTPQGLRAHLYHNANDFSDVETIFVIAPGIPNYPEKEFFEPILDKISKVAFAVVYYYGYWFSSSDFSIAGSANSISDFISALCSGLLVDTFTTKPLPSYSHSINLIGYSFGANAVLNSLAKIDFEEIDKIILAAPLSVVFDEQIRGIDDKTVSEFKKYNLDFSNFIARGYNELIRDNNNELKTHLQGINRSSIIDFPNIFADKIVAYYGDKDDIIKKPFVDILLNSFDIKNINLIEDVGHSKKLIEKAIFDLCQ